MLSERAAPQVGGGAMADEDAPMFKPKETSVDWGVVLGLKEKGVVEKLVKADADGDNDALEALVPSFPPSACTWPAYTPVRPSHPVQPFAPVRASTPSRSV